MLVKCGSLGRGNSVCNLGVELIEQIGVLMDLRDGMAVKAFEKGGAFVPGLVFPSTAGAPLDGINVYHRDFLPCVEAAGLRRITFHALRHSYASHLIHAGASLAYVKEQMRHS